MTSEQISHEVACRIWEEASTGLHPEQLRRYATALYCDCRLGTYRPLNDAEEDQVLLSLYRVDHPRTTMEAFHQLPALSIARYHHLITELAGQGIGPLPRMENAA